MTDAVGAPGGDPQDDGAEEQYETHEKADAPVDRFLQRLVHLATTSGTTLGITLTTGGVLVSGTLASAEQYFQEIGESFAAGMAVDEELGISIRFAFQSWADVYGGEYEDEIQSEDIGFIHVKNAHVYVGDTSFPSDAKSEVWWRGRLTCIDGFTFGEFTRRSS